MDVYFGIPSTQSETTSISKCTTTRNNNVQCYYLLEIPKPNPSAYSVVAFLDILDDEQMHTEDLVPIGWCATEPAGPYAVINVSSSGYVKCDISLFSLTAWSDGSVSYDYGELYPLNGLHILHTWGTPYVFCR